MCSSAHEQDSDNGSRANFSGKNQPEKFTQHHPYVAKTRPAPTIHDPIVRVRRIVKQLKFMIYEKV